MVHSSRSNVSEQHLHNEHLQNQTRREYLHSDNTFRYKKKDLCRYIHRNMWLDELLACFWERTHQKRIFPFLKLNVCRRYNWISRIKKSIIGHVISTQFKVFFIIKIRSQPFDKFRYNLPHFFS